MDNTFCTLKTYSSQWFPSDEHRKKAPSRVVTFFVLKLLKFKVFIDVQFLKTYAPMLADMLVVSKLLKNQVLL